MMAWIEKQLLKEKKFFISIVCSLIVIVSFLAGGIAVNQEIDIKNLIILIEDGIAILFLIWIIIEEVK